MLFNIIGDGCECEAVEVAAWNSDLARFVGLKSFVFPTVAFWVPIHIPNKAVRDEVEDSDVFKVSSMGVLDSAMFTGPLVFVRSSEAEKTHR